MALLERQIKSLPIFTDAGEEAVICGKIHRSKEEIMIDQRGIAVQWKSVAGWSARFLAVLILSAVSHGQDQADLTDLSPEQLSKIEVTSVSKKEQKLSDTAAAVYVITQQDIRNSTAINIPELLHMAPGLDVVQLNGSTWAISVRGFAEQFTDKMLVLIDGRSVFDPLIAGVVWADQDVPLEDIERIEVIRGPGATMWGTNAFNGVINIITKSAQETPGMLVSAGVGNDERSYASVQYGGKLGQSTHYRLFTKDFDDGPAGEFAGLPSHDSWRSVRGGFRVDTRASDRDFLLWEGDAFSGEAGSQSVIPVYTAPFTRSFIDNVGHGGEDLMGRWIHKSLDGEETTLQASWAHVIHPQQGLDVNGSVVGISLQHEKIVGRHDLVAGFSYDFRDAHTSSPDAAVSWSPANLSFNIAGGFMQDEILFLNGVLHFTAGIRVEHNSLSGWDAQPTVRLLWKVSPKQSLWWAYSLANRSADPDDTSLRNNIAIFPTPGGLQVLRLTGNPNIKPERMNAFEMGYRVQLLKTLSLDSTIFDNQYSAVLGQEAGQPFAEAGPPPRLVIPLVQQNDTAGHSIGGELAAQWIPVHALRMMAAYSLIEFEFTQTTAAGVNIDRQLWGEPPRHQLQLSSALNLPRHLELSNALSFVDRRTAQNIPGWTEVDSKLSWRPVESADFSLGVQNLLNKEHIEFISQLGGLPTTLGRTMNGRFTWHF
jgi:iron complex outermembrane recepter protein